MKLTMKEIARLANISTSSVSLILNNRAQGRISEENQRRVQEIIDQYHYHPNLAARRLRQKKALTIGVMLDTPQDTFSASIITSLQTAIEKAGYMVIFSFWKSLSGVPRSVETLLQYNVAGIISWSPTPAFDHSTIPIVLFSSEHSGCSSVLIDYETAIRQAVSIFQEQGHTRFGFLGDPEDPRNIQFKKILKEKGLEIRPEWQSSTDEGFIGAVRDMDQIISLKQRPTALLAKSDSLAQGIYIACTHKNKKIPQDFSVISFNNDPSANVITPPLTTFELPTDKIADDLLSLLLERIADPALPCRTIFITPDLITRASVAPPPKNNKPNVI